MTKKRKPAKLIGSAKVTLAMLSIMSFVGSWNLIARLENEEVQAANNTSIPPPSSPTPAPSSHTQILSAPTPWPVIAPLSEIPPVPTLIPTLTSWQSIPSSQTTGSDEASTVEINIAPVQIAPLPTLAPLPSLPAPPPPPPSPIPQGGGGNQSGGS